MVDAEMVRVAGGSFSMGYKRAGSPRYQEDHRRLGIVDLLGSRASLPAWTTAGPRPIAGWKPALPGIRALKNPVLSGCPDPTLSFVRNQASF